MAEIAARLRRLGPTIERIMSVSGTPGVSIGIAIEGNPAIYENYGLRNVKSSEATNEDTIFMLCSLTKSFTAAALGLLVEEKKFSWDSHLKDVLPTWQSQNPILQENTTIADILSHRTGMGWGDNLILGTDGNVLLSSKDLMKYINHRPLQGPVAAGLPRGDPARGHRRSGPVAPRRRRSNELDR